MSEKSVYILHSFFIFFLTNKAKRLKIRTDEIKLWAIILAKLDKNLKINTTLLACATFATYLLQEPQNLQRPSNGKPVLAMRKSLTAHE